MARHRHRRPDRAARHRGLSARAATDTGRRVSTLAAAGPIAEALARIASSLRTPVLLLALLALLVCALEVGRFATELLARARAGRGALRALTRQVIATPGQAAALSRLAPSQFA